MFDTISPSSNRCTHSLKEASTIWTFSAGDKLSNMKSERVKKGHSLIPMPTPFNSNLSFCLS